jgi:hypothetical protein
VTLQLDDTIDDEAAKIGIKHMYGIKIPFSGRRYPTNLDTSFIHLAGASVFAETYQIAGLAKSAFETADRLMVHCLEDEHVCEKIGNILSARGRMRSFDRGKLLILLSGAGLHVPAPTFCGGMMQ